MESDSESDFEGKEDFSSKQEFKRVQTTLISSGFREGAAAGKDASFQSGFDNGYAAGFQAAFSLGKFNGIVETLRRNAPALSLDIPDLQGCGFENARHGLCNICTESPDQPADSCNKVDCCKKIKDNSVLSEKQRDIVKSALDDQRIKCIPILEKAGVKELLEELGETGDLNQST